MLPERFPSFVVVCMCLFNLCQISMPDLCLSFFFLINRFFIILMASRESHMTEWTQPVVSCFYFRFCRFTDLEGVISKCASLFYFRFLFRSIYRYGKVTILVRTSNRTRICYFLTRFRRIDRNRR